jgi:hypothetical protein
MPQTQLVYFRSSAQILGKEVFYYERIKALLEIGNAAKIRDDCLVDTGAVLSVFPEKKWKTFEKDIHWLYVPGAGAVIPDWIATVTGLGAQPVKCRIGKTTIRIIELPLTPPQPKYSPVVEIIAKFPYDNGAYSQILLGLGGNAHLGWKMTIDSANSRAWLDY